jgi:hypothetical protein
MSGGTIRDSAVLGAEASRSSVYLGLSMPVSELRSGSTRRDKQSGPHFALGRMRRCPEPNLPTGAPTSKSGLRPSPCFFSARAAHMS